MAKGKGKRREGRPSPVELWSARKADPTLQLEEGHRELAERVDTYLKAVELGNTLESAAGFAGLVKQTVRNWLRRGRRARRGPYREFLDAYVIADGKAESIYQGVLAGHTKKSPRAAIAMLERRWPKRWRQRQDHVIKNDGKRPVVFEMKLGTKPLAQRVDGGPLTAPPGSPLADLLPPPSSPKPSDP